MNDCALEVTIVIPKNIIRAYIYEKERTTGKENLRTSQIDGARFKEDGTLLLYRGGSTNEIRAATYNALKDKTQKAKKRLAKHPYICVDLGICMFEGGLFDLFDFELAFNDLHLYPFSKIFFITSSRFIVFSKDSGFKEYARITE